MVSIGTLRSLYPPFSPSLPDPAILSLEYPSYRIYMYDQIYIYIYDICIDFNEYNSAYEVYIHISVFISICMHTTVSKYWTFIHDDGMSLSYLIKEEKNYNYYPIV